MAVWTVQKPFSVINRDTKDKIPLRENSKFEVLRKKYEMGEGVFVCFYKQQVFEVMEETVRENCICNDVPREGESIQFTKTKSILLKKEN